MCLKWELGRHPALSVTSSGHNHRLWAGVSTGRTGSLTSGQEVCRVPCPNPTRNSVQKDPICPKHQEHSQIGISISSAHPSHRTNPAARNNTNIKSWRPSAHGGCDRRVNSKRVMLIMSRPLKQDVKSARGPTVQAPKRPAEAVVHTNRSTRSAEGKASPAPPPGRPAQGTFPSA